MLKLKMRRIVLIGSIAGLALLADFSIVGAFAGPRVSKAFFNSFPLLVFWGLLFLLLAGGFFAWPSLRRRSSLLCIHAGLMLVLAGGMLGSERGHAILDRFSSKERVPRAFITLHEGEIGNEVELDNKQSADLTFDIHLKHAVIEYYPDSGMVKDYRSDLQIIDNAVTVKEAQIEVNKPLYYGGYHFYQNTFGFDQGVPVSGIMIVSARGIVLVFAGYALIAGGVFAHFRRVLFPRRLPQEAA